VIRLKDGETAGETLTAQSMVAFPDELVNSESLGLREGDTIKETETAREKSSEDTIKETDIAREKSSEYTIKETDTAREKSSEATIKETGTVREKSSEATVKETGTVREKSSEEKVKETGTAREKSSDPEAVHAAANKIRTTGHQIISSDSQDSELDVLAKSDIPSIPEVRELPAAGNEPQQQSPALPPDERQRPPADPRRKPHRSPMNTVEPLHRSSGSLVEERQISPIHAAHQQQQEVDQLPAARVAAVTGNSPKLEAFQHGTSCKICSRTYSARRDFYRNRIHRNAVDHRADREG
jgi:hypothetical protein